MADINSIGKNIKRFREDKEWSQQELADKLGVTQRAVSAWESSKAFPRVPALDAMCELFNCRLSDLTNGPSNIKAKVQEIVPDPEPKELKIDVENTDEAAFLKVFRTLTTEQQHKAMMYVVNLLLEGK